MRTLCGWLDASGRSRALGLDGLQGHAIGGDNGTAAALGDIGSVQAVDGWAAEENGVRAGLIGEPRWRNGALEATAGEGGHARALIRAYHEHGTACLDQLAGAFVLAVVDARNRRLLVAIDRMGQFPLYYGQTGDAVLFGTSARAVSCHPAVDSSLSPDGVFHYLYFHMLPSPVSIYRGLRKLEAGQALLAEGEQCHVVQYWLPRFEEPQAFEQQAAGEELRDILRHAVSRVALGNGTGAFLSGGLDSSSVAGMLAGLQPQAPTFSIGFDAEGYDEMGYARIAAKHFSTQANEYYVTPEDVLRVVPLVAESYEEPFGNSSALPAYFCARLAAERGVTRLLAGDGGDELFGGNARYAKQGVFELWHRIPAPVRQRLLEPLVRRLPGRPSPLRKVQSYVQQARVPLPERLQTYNFLHRLPVEEMFEPDYLAQVDVRAPVEAMDELYHRPEEASTLNRMLYLDWQHTLADNDLRKVRQMCDRAGVDVVFPMLDDSLVEFSLRVPSRLKIRNGRLRHFYKEAFRGFLPTEILDKKKHGFGLPFGVWMQEHQGLQELAYDSLLQLKGQHIIRPEFLDRLIHLHRDGHAAYFGELIWVLMMLDLWLETHQTHASAETGRSTGT